MHYGNGEFAPGEVGRPPFPLYHPLHPLPIQPPSQQTNQPTNQPTNHCPSTRHLSQGIKYGDKGQYTAAHHLLLAHTAAARLYSSRFRPAQRGRLGIALNTFWMEPRDGKSEADRAAAQRALDQDLGWFADPLFFGDYPEVRLVRAGLTR
jgi:beta-glucosidase/6-phospho-beta-glucosidase/beta-galactosidase